MTAAQYQLSGAGRFGVTALRRVGTYVLPFVAVAAVWQFASLFFPPFLFPSLVDVFWRFIGIVTD